MSKIVAGKVTPDDPLSECIYSKFKKVTLASILTFFSSDSMIS